MAALPPRWGKRICRVINLLLKWKYGGGGKFSKSGEPCSKNFGSGIDKGKNKAAR